MKNDSLDFNIPSSNQEELLNFNQTTDVGFQQQNNELFPNNFDADLNLSNIINHDNNELLKNKKNQNILSTEKSFDESLENFSRINVENENIENMNLEESEIQSEIMTNENNQINEEKKKSKKKRTKEDLNNTPLPVFECLYCTNEKVVFQHFINEILSDKYLLQTSIYDINDLNKLILNKRLINNNKDEKLLNLVMKNTEYMKIYMQKSGIDNYFKSEIFNKLCIKVETDINRLFKHKIEDSIVRKKKDFYFKGINKIPKNSMNNKGLFNSTNSLINNFNALSGLVEPVQTNNVNNNIKNNNTIGTCSNNSINFNSLSLNNNEFNCYCKDNNNMLDYIVEKIEKNEESVNYVDDKDLIIDFFKFDLSRKINKKDIKWENKIYNIYNPDISSDFDENDYDDENDYYNINKISNDTKNKSINMNINNINNKGIPINKNLSNKSMGFIKYHKNRGKNLIFTFNKKIDKAKHNRKNINNNTKEKPNNANSKSNNINDNISNDNTFNSNSNICIISLNDNNQTNITKDLSEKNYPISNITNKSVSINNIIINKKSKDTNNKIPKQKNHINNKNTILNNRKNVLSGISFLKSFSSITNSNCNINKSVNILGKSKKKINYSIQNMNKRSKSKNKNNVNIKSLQYMSNSKNSNASTNYSIGISINLKSNSSVKSNGFLQSLNYENSMGNAVRIFNDNKSINGISLNERKKSSKNLIQKNKLFNLFNNLNLMNFKQKYQRAKSNYQLNNQKNEKIIAKSSKSISVYKNKNRKNNYNIYKKNKTNKQNIFNFSSDRQNKVVIPRGIGPLLSSNSKRFDNLYSNSMGLSIGSIDNNNSEPYTHMQFNSISNLNKSNSNGNNSIIYSNSKNNSKHLFSPNKFNKTYYNNNINNKRIKNKLNDLIFMVNHNRNKNYENNYRNNMIDFKNKSINLINSKSFLKKQGYKSSKRFMFK